MKLTEFPHLVKEWHPTKNGDLRPEDVTHGSGKKVWWLCPQGHSYEKNISHRTSVGVGCPYCSGRKASSDNNLLTKFPDIAKEWHPEKNGDLTPKDVVYNSSKNVWWFCPKGHSYQSTPGKRTVAKPYTYGCPYCSGRKVDGTNSLLATYPEIAEEWHPEKNGDLKPEMFTKGSTKKVWWLCSKNHYYETAIKDRATKNSGCPYCSNQSSEPEVRLLSELRGIFKDVKNRNKIDGIELDIFLPEVSIGIEYDGSYWHKDKQEADLSKNKSLLSKGVQLLRVRQKPLKKLSDKDIVVDNGILKSNVDSLLKNIQLLIGSNYKDEIDSYLKRPSFINEDLFREYRNCFPNPLPEHSLSKLFPDIGSEWDYDKNHPLRPESFTAKSKSKVWWLCPKGHSYETTIGERTREDKKSGGCPYCSGRRASKENNLQDAHPDIAKEWHPDKNKGLIPKDFTRASDKKAWWLCPKGHSYKATVKNRTNNKSGCPYCAGKFPSNENNLVSIFPEIAKEFHPSKNGNESPYQFTYGSKRKIWWLCSKGHSYEATVNSRTNKRTGCPYCAGKKSLTPDLFES